jgi:hypothetical protein
MAVPKEEIVRRTDLLKIMFYIATVDLPQYDFDASKIWEEYVKDKIGEAELTTIAADNVLFLSTIRIFASIFQSAVLEDVGDCL